MKKLKIKIPPELWTRNIQNILDRTLHEYNTEPPYLTSFLCDPQLSEEELEIALKLLEAENAETTKQKLIKAELETRRKPIVEEAFPADLRQEWTNMQRAAEKTKKRNRNKKNKTKSIKRFYERGREMKKYIKCPECPMCKPQPGKRDGVKWGICHNGGNMVYLEPRKIKRASGSGYIYKPISGCGMYEKGE